jgi:hypothetical protein
MADAGSSTEVIVLAYLKGQGFYRSLMALEDESNMCSDAYDGEMMFLRWLMYYPFAASVVAAACRI